MFTGIVEEVGTVHRLEENQSIHRYQILATVAFAEGVKTGDSICVNGVCLTVCNVRDDSFQVDVSTETRKCTTFGTSAQKGQVNLERSAMPSTRLGGHIVSGHVDGIGRLMVREDGEGESVLWIAIPDNLSRYIVPKGSVCVDGVSLTVNQVEKNRFCVTVIPHTLKSTTLGHLQPGTEMNIEVDLMARYLERLMQDRGQAT
ncbi:MAG: riboflavin synthase [Proteobacteria bacterium]|nr:riboflavin synthase [Pseudomonadota bacterium]